MTSENPNTPVTAPTVGEVHVPNPIIQATDVNVYYGQKHAIHHVNLDIGSNSVIALIGP